MLNTVWHNPCCTCRSWSLLCRSVSLLFEAPHLAGVGCNLLLQAQVAVQQRLGAGFVFAVVLAGQKGLPLPQPRVCFVDVSKVLKRHREEKHLDSPWKYHIQLLPLCQTEKFQGYFQAL